MAQPPFHVPAEPVDGYRVIWFKVRSDYWIRHFGEVEECSAVYRANATWKDVFPKSDVNGAGFHDEWQIFDGDRFVGRRDRWASFSEFEWRGCYPTREEAAAAGVEMVREKAAELGRAYNLLASWLQGHGVPAELLTRAPQPMTLTGQDLKAFMNQEHLARCSACGRKTWAPADLGTVCGMPQPNGATCTGRFPLAEVSR